MNIPRQRRYPMRPIPPRTTYNITINETKTTPAKVAAALPVDAALGGPSGQYPQPTYGKARSAGRVPVQLKEI